MSKLIATLPNGSKRYVTGLTPNDIKISIYPTYALNGFQLIKAISIARSNNLNGFRLAVEQ